MESSKGKPLFVIFKNTIRKFITAASMRTTRMLWQNTVFIPSWNVLGPYFFTLLFVGKMVPFVVLSGPLQFNMHVICIITVLTLPTAVQQTDSLVPLFLGINSRISILGVVQSTFLIVNSSKAENCLVGNQGLTEEYFLVTAPSIPVTYH